ncbi:MAG TPA: alpha/beta fold hydrolase [Pseudonocardiaceae bacterium]|nr:alpha/beta fold hydrolase [Pseudonocardiaceae bacterium]
MAPTAEPALPEPLPGSAGKDEDTPDMTDPRVYRFAGRDGLELTYRETGEGRPLILLHGFIASGSQWLGHGRAFTEHGYRLILPDLRGHGDSTRPHDPACYPPDVLADDGLALIDRLGLDDYDLGGYSLGARVVLRMLVRGARPARAVVAGQGLARVVGAARNGTNRRVVTALANGDPIEPGSPDSGFASWITQLGNDPLALLRVLDSLVTTPEDALRRVDTRTLVAVGDQDQDHASADALAAILPNARFVQVPGNHWTAFTAPALATAMIAFLTEQSE